MICLKEWIDGIPQVLFWGPPNADSRISEAYQCLAQQINSNFIFLNLLIKSIDHVIDAGSDVVIVSSAHKPYQEYLAEVLKQEGVPRVYLDCYIERKVSEIERTIESAETLKKQGIIDGFLLYPIVHPDTAEYNTRVLRNMFDVGNL